MRDFVWYLAHPVAGDAQANAQRALRWLRWLRREEPDACIVAPWLASLLSGDDDNDPRARDRAIDEAKIVACRCDGIILVGGRVSKGMQVECDAITDGGGVVCDLTSLGDEPPGAQEIDELLTEADRGYPYATVKTVLELGQRYWEAA